MNILIINPILYTADNDLIPKVDTIKNTMIYNMCLGFMKNAHKVTLVAAAEYKPIQNEEYDFPIHFIKSSMKWLFKPSLLPFQIGLWRYLKQNGKKYDLILSSEVFSIASLFSSVLYPSKTVLWHELTAHNKKLFRFPSLIWYNIIARVFMRKVLVIPRSLPAYSFIRQYFHRVSNSIVDHGINIDNFLASNHKKKQFIVVAQLIPRKNIESIIDKFLNFTQIEGYQDYMLYIAGRGYLLETLIDKVKVNNATSNIIFLGYLDHQTLNRYIRESYALLLDTKQDLNVVSIPESIVSGTPIVTNSVPALASFIQKYKLGIVNDDWDFNDLMKIISTDSYSNNCMKMRDFLSSQTASRRIVSLFESN